MYHEPSSLILSLAQWIQSDQDLLGKSSGQTTLSLVCTLVFVVYLFSIVIRLYTELITVHIRFTVSVVEASRWRVVSEAVTDDGCRSERCR